MKLRFIFAALVACMPIYALAQGHRGADEPPLDAGKMELPAS